MSKEINHTKTKRLSKGKRTHTRRLKQEANNSRTIIKQGKQ